jgi:uncharacterized metal-binding protein YceD (DUF177 family)
MTEHIPFRVADLSHNAPVPFNLRPDPPTLNALASELGLLALRKLSFVGHITAQGDKDWNLRAKLGATVVQPCVVTLDPVTTRIDIDVERTYLADMAEQDDEEAEMEADDSVEPLGSTIDPAAVMAEALTLALPLYPRKDNADLGSAVFTEPGKAPLSDDDVKPFAGLAGLRDQLSDDN